MTPLKSRAEDWAAEELKKNPSHVVMEGITLPVAFIEHLEREAYFEGYKDGQAQ